MWTFDHLPLDTIRQRHGVVLSPQLVQHLQAAAVNFGASASFVSPHGLLMTNHHVAASCIAKLSSASRDLSARGHVARRPADELRCPGANARVLQGIEDVSAVVQQAAAAGSTDAQKNANRKAAIADLEARCRATTGLHCEVVSLYSGSLYHLYRYRQWDDVRLVFAPEAQAANFGGDDDNFVYPRYAFDVALLRVYENGRPLRTDQHLRLARRPAAEGDPVFVVGHPGRTFRLRTVAQLKHLRDVDLPMQVASAQAQQALLRAFSARSAEAARRAQDTLFGIENWLKSSRGALAALNTPALLERKQAEEAELRAGYARQRLPGDPWADIEAAVARSREQAHALWAVGYGDRNLFEQAGRLVELAYERRLPDSERLAAYRESELARLERQLKARQPVYKDLEAARLAGLFEEARRLLGPDHAHVRALLAGDSPAVAAERLVQRTGLDQPAEREALLAGGVAAVEASSDPLIQLARKVYPLRRELQKAAEEQIHTPIEQAAQQLGQARFALYGHSVPPDATGTLRLAYGRVAGYASHGVTQPWKTTLGGLLARADAFDQKPPFELPAQIARQRDRLDPRVPLNFVTTLDITGGNSGSPVVNRDGEWVGVVFDGNLESLGGRFVYSDQTARSIVVDARAVLQALEKIYDAGVLARELRSAPGPVTP